VLIEPRDDELMIKRTEDLTEVLEWIRERRKSIGGKEARLGDLANVDLEEEFNDENILTTPRDM